MAENKKGVANVTVNLKCKGLEKSIYQNRKGFTDEYGMYKLKGYWDLEGCSIHFSHNNYKPTVVTVDNSYVIKRSGLSINYEVNATLRIPTQFGHHSEANPATVPT